MSLGIPILGLPWMDEGEHRRVIADRGHQVIQTGQSQSFYCVHYAPQLGRMAAFPNGCGGHNQGCVALTVSVDTALWRGACVTPL